MGDDDVISHRGFTLQPQSITHKSQAEMHVWQHSGRTPGFISVI